MGVLPVRDGGPVVPGETSAELFDAYVDPVRDEVARRQKAWGEFWEVAFRLAELLDDESPSPGDLREAVRIERDRLMAEQEQDIA